MKPLLAALGLVLLVAAPVHAAVAPAGVIPASDIFFDDDDGYTDPGEGGESEPTNPCAPETYDASECVTPE
jgi:hypothetical protein